MAPTILREFLQTDPELIVGRHDKLPIHSCIKSGENPNVLKFLSILLEANHNSVNIPTSEGMLPIHLAALHSTVEVVQILYEYSIHVIAPGLFGSVANMAAYIMKLDILKYIHSINPELILLAPIFCRTPLYLAVIRWGSKCSYVEEVYALGPTAISKVQFY